MERANGKGEWKGRMEKTNGKGDWKRRSFQSQFPTRFFHSFFSFALSIRSPRPSTLNPRPSTLDPRRVSRRPLAARFVGIASLDPRSRMPTTDLDLLAINTIRTLAMDAVQ